MSPKKLRCERADTTEASNRKEKKNRRSIQEKKGRGRINRCFKLVHATCPQCNNGCYTNATETERENHHHTNRPTLSDRTQQLYNYDPPFYSLTPSSPKNYSFHKIRIFSSIPQKKHNSYFSSIHPPATQHIQIIPRSSQN